MIGFMVSMVASGHEDVLSSRDFGRERDELKEKYKALERENSEVGKELAELWKKIELGDLL